MSCNNLTNFEYEEAFAKTRTYQFCCNLAKRHLYLRWSEERTIDDDTKIKLALSEEAARLLII